MPRLKKTNNKAIKDNQRKKLLPKSNRVADEITRVLLDVEDTSFLIGEHTKSYAVALSMRNALTEEAERWKKRLEADNAVFDNLQSKLAQLRANG